MKCRVSGPWSFVPPSSWTVDQQSDLTSFSHTWHISLCICFVLSLMLQFCYLKNTWT